MRRRDRSWILEILLQCLSALPAVNHPYHNYWQFLSYLVTWKLVSCMSISPFKPFPVLHYSVNKNFFSLVTRNLINSSCLVVLGWSWKAVSLMANQEGEKVVSTFYSGWLLALRVFALLPSSRPVSNTYFMILQTEWLDTCLGSGRSSSIFINRPQRPTLQSVMGRKYIYK